MTFRRILPLFLLLGCFTRRELVAVNSSLDVRTTLDVVERVFATAGYAPVSEDDVADGREVVHTPWRAYPPGHEANGPYERRPVAIITPKKTGTEIELRIDVTKCVQTSSEPRCDSMDLLFESDKKELDILKSRLETELRNTQKSVVVTTSVEPSLAPGK